MIQSENIIYIIEENNCQLIRMCDKDMVTENIFRRTNKRGVYEEDIKDRVKWKLMTKVAKTVGSES